MFTEKTLLMKITEYLGIVGFLFSLITFFLTRIERRKKLTINLSVDFLNKIDKSWSDDSDFSPEQRIIVIDVINDGTRIIVLDKESVELVCNHKRIKHGFDLIGKDKFTNPLKPGDNFSFGVFIDSVVDHSEILDRNNGIYNISASVKDVKSKIYKSSKKYNRSNIARIFIGYGIRDSFNSRSVRGSKMDRLHERKIMGRI